MRLLPWVCKRVYLWVYQSDVSGMPRAYPSNEPRHSGLPGLRWRQRGNGGTWVVSLAVPTALRDRVVNSKGKSLTRLERSTGTDSLKLAKERYPKLMTQLRQELAERAGTALMESKQDASLRVVAKLYSRLASPDALAQHESSMAKTEEVVASLAHLPLSTILDQISQYKHLLLGMTRSHFATEGLPLDESEIPQAFASIKSAVLAARDLQQSRTELGFLAEPTPIGKKLAKAAKQPKPVSIFEVADQKKSRLSSRTHENLLRTCKNWKAIIGESSLRSITSSHLNYFARTLNQPKPGGYGYSTDNANNETARLRSLLKFYNEHQRDDSARYPYPEWERIVPSAAELKQRVRQGMDKATNKDEVLRLLDWAYLEFPDKYAWLYVLLIDNTTFRNEEACLLRWGNVTQQDRIWFFNLEDSKTASGIRKVPLNTRLINYLLPLKGDDSEYIINNRWPHWSSPKDGAGSFLRKAKSELGLKGNINPHAFRHGAGGDLGYNQTEHIKKTLLGHSGNITDHYTRNDWLRLREAVEGIGTDWKPPDVFPPPPLKLRFQP